MLDYASALDWVGLEKAPNDGLCLKEDVGGCLSGAGCLRFGVGDYIALGEGFFGRFRGMHGAAACD